MSMEKESITITVEALKNGKNSVYSPYKDKYEITVDATREKISKELRLFLELLKASFDH